MSQVLDRSRFQVHFLILSVLMVRNDAIVEVGIEVQPPLSVHELDKLMS